MNAQSLERSAAGAPYYVARGGEVAIFEQCHAQQLAVMLKGPTGCGKTRFVEYMAWQLERELVTISCHDDLTASDLVGRMKIDSVRARMDEYLVARFGRQSVDL